tara:strand:+ start:1526 stop:3001 length:1476 start_codon:yes stop_codon:yes gene_type:complete
MPYSFNSTSTPYKDYAYDSHAMLLSGSNWTATFVGDDGVSISGSILPLNYNAGAWNTTSDPNPFDKLANEVLGTWPGTADSVRLPVSNSKFYLTCEFDQVTPLHKFVVDFWGGNVITDFDIELSLDGTNFYPHKKNNIISSSVPPATSVSGAKFSTNPNYWEAGPDDLGSVQNGSPSVYEVNLAYDHHYVINKNCKAFRIKSHRILDSAPEGDVIFHHLTVFRSYCQQSSNVEFDDALLDQAGWKNSRYEGSKLTGERINSYNVTDVTYGKNPVVENKIAALYIGSTIIGGDSGPDGAEEDAYVKLSGHSYVNINKVLLINLDTDEVEIIDRQNLGEEAFKRMIDTDLYEGSTINLKLLDIAVDNSLKKEHFVKFNRGSLQKIYAYTANTGGFEDGVFGGFQVRENIGNVHTGSLQGTGLFGYGCTTALSRSLFNTQSIKFVSIFPTELVDYLGDITPTSLGTSLAPITTSVNQAGSGYAVEADNILDYIK